MIWYKSSIQERLNPFRAKMCQGSPVCQQTCETIIEMFKNNVPQRKIERDLDNISDVTTWVQDYFGKHFLSSNTIRSYIHKFQKEALC